MYMFVTGERPSGIGKMFALSRTPAMAAPAWTFPIRGSFSRQSSVRPKLTSWEFQLRSVKPRKYAKSCSRLCMANRLTAAAESSHVAPGAPGVGSHCPTFQSFVHGNR